MANFKELKQELIKYKFNAISNAIQQHYDFIQKLQNSPKITSIKISEFTIEYN